MARIINWNGQEIKTQPKEPETRALELDRERERRLAQYAFQLRQEAARALCGQ